MADAPGLDVPVEGAPYCRLLLAGVTPIWVIGAPGPSAGQPSRPTGQRHFGRTWRQTGAVDLKPWPTDFREKKAGIGCPQCQQGRVGDTEHGVRYFVGEISDGYLQRSGPTAGYSVVVFRGRHVGAPHEMTAAEHAAFWTEVGTVAAAIEQVYEPVHLNFQILGNQDPHVHVHIVPRYDPDPAPSMPVSSEMWLASKRLDDGELTRQVEALQAVAAT